MSLFVGYHWMYLVQLQNRRTYCSKQTVLCTVVLQLMAQHGATLQSINNALIKCIEELKERRSEVNRQILKEVRNGTFFLYYL